MKCLSNPEGLQASLAHTSRYFGWGLSSAIVDVHSYFKLLSVLISPILFVFFLIGWLTGRSNSKRRMDCMSIAGERPYYHCIFNSSIFARVFFKPLVCVIRAGLKQINHVVIKLILQVSHKPWYVTVCLKYQWVRTPLQSALYLFLWWTCVSHETSAISHGDHLRVLEKIYILEN